LNRRRPQVNEVHHAFKTQPAKKKRSWNAEDVVYNIWVILLIIYVVMLCIELRANQVRKQCKQKGIDEPNWVKYWTAKK
jgi:hypothetical protein